MNILDQNIKAEYLNKHIPYRINSMLAHDLLLHRKKQLHFNDIKDSCYGDSLIVEPIFEISMIFGRSLLNFIGIGLNKKDNTLKQVNGKESDDVTIKSLYPDRDFCSLEDQIVIDNYEELCNIIRLADKSVAHLTSIMATTDNHNKLPKARLAIYQLLIKYLPEIDKEKIWWHTQVEK